MLGTAAVSGRLARTDRVYIAGSMRPAGVVVAGMGELCGALRRLCKHWTEL